MAESPPNPVPLAERYDAAALARAEERRSKLAHGRLKVGADSHPRVKRILDLLFHAHQNYYFGLWEACCVVSGVLYEQSLLLLLEEKMEKDGSLSVRDPHAAGGVRSIRDAEDLARLNLFQLGSMAKFHRVLPYLHEGLASDLRLARNHLMHDRLPAFAPKGGAWVASLQTEIRRGITATQTIELPQAEVAARMAETESPALWAYWFLTRVRTLMGTLFAPRIEAV
ncbi:MAG: hypothetical protein J0L75_02950 [Spirochaetes bacterium]|nr:hypothetical protein [Spirochaetota bacterium]